jgi:3-oxoacyl-[acyl-carrier protein] reductase
MTTQRSGRACWLVSASTPASVPRTCKSTTRDGPRADNVAKIPVGRLGKVDEIASVVLTVVGNAYMNGQTIAVNGGMTFN